MTDAPFDRRAWLEARRKGCGASDVAGILGKSPWASPWSVWAEKCNLIPIAADPTDPDDIRTFGLDLEPLIAEKFQRRTGLYVAGRQQMIHHPDEAWCFATLDGLVADADYYSDEEPADPLGVFESKYTADPPWDQLPEHYAIAGQWQMYVTGLDHLWLACLHLPFGRPRLRIYELDRDDDQLADIIATVTQFWIDHVVTGKPPPADGHHATTEAIRQVWGSTATTKDRSIDLTDHTKLVDELARIRKEKAALEWLEDKVANGIKQLIAERAGRPGPDPKCPTCAGQGIETPATPDEVDAGCELGYTYLPCPDCPNPTTLSDAYIDDELAVSWRSQPDTRIDTAAVRADHGTAYDKTTTKRILRLHGKRNP